MQGIVARAVTLGKFIGGEGTSCVCCVKACRLVPIWSGGSAEKEERKSVKREGRCILLLETEVLVGRRGVFGMT